MENNRYFPEKNMDFPFEPLLHMGFDGMLIPICSVFIKLVCCFIDVGQSKSVRADEMGGA